MFLTWFVFLFIAIKKIEINWLLFAYPAVPVIITINYLRHVRIRKILIPYLLTLITLSFVLFPTLFDTLNLSHIYPPKTDTFYRLSGWEKLGKHVSTKTEAIESDKIFLFSDSYHIASELSFYTEGNPQTHVINTGRRMNQFDLWKGIEQYKGKPYTAIYVSGKPATEKLISGFHEMKSHDTYKRTYRGTTVQTLHIYVFVKLMDYQDNNPVSY